MQVRIEFTHRFGQLATSRSARESVTGDLCTVLQHSKSGVYQVAQVRSPEPLKPPLAELLNVELYCIGTNGLHLRGLEVVQLEGRPTHVLQGWLITVPAPRGPEGAPTR